MVSEWLLTEKQAEHIQDDTNELCVEGSAGSGKTLFACSKTIFYGIENAGARIGIFRKTLPSLKRTSWLEIRKLLDNHGIVYEENKADGLITLSNGTTMSFSGLDDLSKVRSLNLDYIYIEQAEQIDRDTYLELKLRLRGSGADVKYRQAMLVVQPENPSHWIYQYFHVNGYGKILHFSYKTNSFLPAEHREYYERLEEIDETAYRRYSLGEWCGNGNLIFTNWDKETRDTFNFYAIGVDFGFSVPSAVVLIGFYDLEPYVLDEVYEKELTTEELFSRIKDMLIHNNLGFNDIDLAFADAAEPDRIKNLNEWGLYTEASVKDVKGRINTTKLTKIHIDEDKCPHLIKEIQSYSWRKDKDGNVTDVPVKVNDHAVDALQYAIYGMLGTNSPYRTDGTVDLSEVSVF